MATKGVDIWIQFKDKAAETKSIVLSGEKPCSYKITGKNTTNLKTHLKLHFTETEVTSFALLLMP